MVLASKQQFAPLCDLHHTPMRRMVQEEDTEESHTYHACARGDCTRVFRDTEGYSDLIGGDFDNSRASAQACPRCGTVLYLAAVDHSRKIETWECLLFGCDFSEEYPSPSAR